MTRTTPQPKPAQRTVRKARLSLWGKSGSGKTLTALKIARGLAGPEGKILLIDTEQESSTLYADDQTFDILAIDPPYESSRFVEILKTVAPHYDVLILDTASHEWNGEGGCLERVDTEKVKLGNNEWAAWSKITPDHHRFLSALVRSPAHVICTLRAKTVTDQQVNQTTKKKEVVELGLFPVQRYDGEEFCYEMDIAARLDPEGTNVRLTVTNSRYRDWHGKSFLNPGEALGHELATWLNKGVAPVATHEPTPEPITPVNVVDTREGPFSDPVTSHNTGSTPPPAAAKTKPQSSAGAVHANAAAAEQAGAPAPAQSAQEPPPPQGSMSRGEMLGAVQRFLFHLRPERDESGRKARVRLLDGAFGVLSMTDLADQSDGVIATGLRRLQAKAQSSGDLAAATGKPRQRERQPGEDDN